MALAVRDRTESTLSEINVTPLVDVMLVLLIIFMITAPMLSSSVDVELATSSVMPQSSEKEHLVITVTSDQRIFIADTQVTDIEQLGVKVKERFQATGIQVVAIRGDKNVPYGTILTVLDRLNAASIRSVGLVMEPPRRSGTP